MKIDFRELLGKTDPVILEIGCANGNDSAEFLKDFKNVKLFCFEPDTRGIFKFKQNIRDRRCTLIESAVGDKDGSVEFYMSSGTAPNHERYGDWDLSSSIKKPKMHLVNHPWCKFKEAHNVRCLRLDTWAQKNKINNIDLIWADVQGAERELISGGMETLSKTRFFYTEYSEAEEYEGALDVEGISKLLPDFEVVVIMDYDVLMKNKKK